MPCHSCVTLSNYRDTWHHYIWTLQTRRSNLKSDRALTTRSRAILTLLNIRKTWPLSLRENKTSPTCSPLSMQPTRCTSIRCQWARCNLSWQMMKVFCLRSLTSLAAWMANSQTRQLWPCMRPVVSTRTWMCPVSLTSLRRTLISVRVKEAMTLAWVDSMKMAAIQKLSTWTWQAKNFLDRRRIQRQIWIKARRHRHRIRVSAAPIGSAKVKRVAQQHRVLIRGSRHTCRRWPISIWTSTWTLRWISTSQVSKERPIRWAPRPTKTPPSRQREKPPTLRSRVKTAKVLQAQPKRGASQRKFSLIENLLKRHKVCQLASSATRQNRRESTTTRSNCQLCRRTAYCQKASDLIWSKKVFRNRCCKLAWTQRQSTLSMRMELSRTHQWAFKRVNSSSQSLTSRPRSR